MTSSTLASMLLCALLAQSGDPSGRPPAAGGPLERYEPRIYEVRFNVHLGTEYQHDAWEKRNYNLENAPIVWPLTYQSTFSSVDPASVSARLFLGTNEVENLAQISRIEAGKQFNTHLLILPIQKFTGQNLRFEIIQHVQVWSSRLKSEEDAAKIAWPREWPKEVQDGLKPQMFIESDDAMFAQAVEKISQGQLRSVPPYLAAKDLVRSCIDNAQVEGSGTNRGTIGEIEGLAVDGAKFIAESGRGSPHDLVCLCVATLRAAGIPARPVIGVYEKKKKNDTKRNDFVSWAEFYLPEVGWIPFDPVEMKGKGIRHRDVREAWPEFGTMKDLNLRIPLAFGFLPAATVEVPENAAIWGWDPRPGGDPSTDQDIGISIISRGRGEEEPKPTESR